MSEPRAFISFDFDHNEAETNLFVGQAKNFRTQITVEDWSSKEHLLQDSCEGILNDKIARCDLMIVLVGLHSFRAVGVKKEISFGLKNNVPVFGVYVGGATIWTALPNGLYRNRVVRWGWDEISIKIKQCMKEGKNR